jgi:hypothetical protein
MRSITFIGWFFKGKPLNWVVHPEDDPDILKVTEEGRVLVGGIEIEDWTKARKRSLDGKGWIKP